MPRRASLPGAEELFRSTAPAPGTATPNMAEQVPEPSPSPAQEQVRSAASTVPVALTKQSLTGHDHPSAPAAPLLRSGRLPEGGDAAEISGRPRHEEKVTFYCTGADLNRLEQVRLSLRTENGLACDRSRIIRAALAEVLEDFQTKGADSALVRHLSSS